VLLVEDDPAVRSLTREILEMSGYLVLEAADVTEALRIGAQHSGRIELAITDVVMPHMGGRHVVEKLRSLRPETRILYMSGYSDDRCSGMESPRRRRHFSRSHSRPTR